MNTLARWDPFRESQSLRSFIDRYFDEPFFSAPQLWSQRNESYALPLDVIEEEGEYIIKASIPGVNPEDVEITLTDNVLTIKGDMKQENERNEANYHVRERSSGSFMRQIALPTAVTSDHVEATNENGVLTLHLPKSEAAKPKKISVKMTVEGASQPKHNGNAS
jgi:HSP20 family protein